MPWKECHVMDQRVRFVARRLEGESMAALCAEFGISRKTGYKIFDRYKDCGVKGLTDRSRRPYRQANRQAIGLAQLPAISTVHAVLDRHGLVKRRRRHHSTAATFSRGRPNPMRCGVPTTRASSCSAIAGTATR
jgi:putative transposase